MQEDTFRFISVNVFANSVSIEANPKCCIFSPQSMEVIRHRWEYAAALNVGKWLLTQCRRPWQIGGDVAL